MVGADDGRSVAQLVMTAHVTGSVTFSDDSRLERALAPPAAGWHHGVTLSAHSSHGHTTDDGGGVSWISNVPGRQGRGAMQ